MKRQASLRNNPSHKLNPGDNVYLEATHIKTKRPTKKLDDKQFGPFEIIEKVGASAYHLRLPETWKLIHPVFHESLLTPFHEPKYPGQTRNTRPQPDIVNDIEEYEIERIQDVRKRRRKIEYLVKWKGYPKEESTWEPKEHLVNAEEALQVFYNERLNALK